MNTNAVANRYAGRLDLGLPGAIRRDPAVPTALLRRLPDLAKDTQTDFRLFYLANLWHIAFSPFGREEPVLKPPQSSEDVDCVTAGHHYLVMVNLVVRERSSLLKRTSGAAFV